MKRLSLAIHTLYCVSFGLLALTDVLTVCSRFTFCHMMLPCGRLTVCECCLCLAEGVISGQEGDSAVGDNDGPSWLDAGGTHRRGKDHNI